MKHFNYLLPAIILFIFTASCKKSSDVKPSKINTGSIPTGPSAPAAPIDTDAFIHSISFTAPAQYVTTSVSGNQLTMVYNENVTLFIPKEGYNLSWAVHLTENFKNAVLSKFSYTTINSEGDVTTDWVDDNLSNITAKTVSDTTINSIAMVKINVKRAFTFTNAYDDNASAVDAQNAILLLNTDKITFSSYVFFTSTYPATTTNLAITYLKGN